MGKKNEVAKFVSSKIAYLENEGQAKDANALFAILRRGIGHHPGERPELYGIILTDMPESFLSKSGEPTREEWACYIAMTLYALHQQGFDVTKHPMHTNEHVSIGKAMLSFTNHDKDSNSRMYKRLQMLVTSKDMGELSTHLRSIIQLIKSEGIALNYALLASDLYEFQFTEQKSKVCFRWGQDFCRNIKEED